MVGPGPAPVNRAPAPGPALSRARAYARPMRDPDRILPYGSWPSPISPARVVAGARAAHTPTPDGGDLYLVENRPDEQGRSVLIRRTADGGWEDVTPAETSVRSRVHEYGGRAYAVDGGEIVYSSFADGRLWRIAGRGAPAVPLTAERPLRYADPAFDRTHRRILAIVEDHAESDLRPENAIAAVSLADGAVTFLVRGHDFFSDARPSPDGRRLLWLSWDDPRMPWDGTELWVAEVARDGALGEPVRIAGGPDEAIVSPAWAPDGSIVYASDRSGWWNLYRHRPGVAGDLPLAPVAAEMADAAWILGDRRHAVDTDGTVVGIVIRDATDRLAVVADGRLREIPIDATALSGLVVRDGTAWLMAGGPTRMSALLSVDLATGTVTEIRPNGTLPVPAESLSTPRHLAFPSAGGRTAYAWLYPPHLPGLRAPEGERPPLVVLSHGGPTGRARTSLDLSIQALTSRGIAVVDVDYGGSTGYGRDYRRLLDGAWGVVDVEDCVAAATALVEEGRVDPARLAISGGSAGGYTTLCALAFTDRFTAGISAYGIGDLEALALDSHKFEGRYTDRLVGPLPETLATWRERSPIHAVDRISCPVLVLQGEDDKVVPPTQAEAIVAALAARGIPYAYLLFPGEGHGFRRAESRRRAQEAELGFLADIFGFTLAEPVERAPLIRPAR